MVKPYSLTSRQNETGTADLYLFGDIVEQEWWLEDNSPNGLLWELGLLGDLETLHVHIDSYGGETSAGITIYNLLRNLKCKVITYAEGFACSAASLIFCAGESRIMRSASLLMIHPAWTCTQGNAEELRRTADDLEKISDVAANIYRDNSTLEEADLQELIKNESWITPQEALDYGLATAIENETDQTGASYSSAFRAIYQKLTEEAKATEKTDKAFEKATGYTPEPLPGEPEDHTNKMPPDGWLFENFC